jgi:hypothetical protein
MSRFPAGNVEMTEEDAALSGQGFCNFNFASSPKKFGGHCIASFRIWAKLFNWGDPN